MKNNIITQILGSSEKKVLDQVRTVADVKRKLGVENYTATVNGTPVQDNYELEESDFVALSTTVKGGLI